MVIKHLRPSWDDPPSRFPAQVKHFSGGLQSLAEATLCEGKPNNPNHSSTKLTLEVICLHHPAGWWGAFYSFNNHQISGKMGIRHFTLTARPWKVTLPNPISERVLWKIRDTFHLETTQMGGGRYPTVLSRTHKNSKLLRLRFSLKFRFYTSEN